jgi:DNA-directed RNA polymerase specialized sigma24 family protein
MTADETAEFIALWTEGLSLKDIAARLGIPPGTVSSRAAALRRRRGPRQTAAGWGLSESAGQGPAGGLTY